jgi:distribution and morphology protein 10
MLPTILKLFMIANRKSNYLLYGRVFEDLKLEGLYSCGLSERDMISISGMNSWNSDKAEFNAQYACKGKNWIMETGYTSEDHVLGANALYKIPETGWAVGGELFYTAKENSGGCKRNHDILSLAMFITFASPVSLGAKYTKALLNNLHSVVTFIANPMMGHLSTSYTATVLVFEIRIFFCF